MDTFEFVNSINLALQGKEITILQCLEKLTAFKLKLELRDSMLEKKNYAQFPQLNTYIDENKLSVDDDILEVTKRHVSIFREEITNYFPDLEELEKYHLFVNNLSVLSSIDGLSSEDNLIQERCIDFIKYGGATLVFREMSCSDVQIVMT